MEDFKYEFTQEMYNAFEIITQKHENIFITGRAGTGKTMFMQKIRETLTKERTVVLAPTGIAALNARGQTVHSLFMLPFGPIEPRAVDFDNLDLEKNSLDLGKRQFSVLRKVKYIIIDEVSMLRCDVLDEINRKLQIIKRSKRPFGGVQMIMFGDLYQLPPVVKSDDQEILRHYYGNKGFYFFDAKVWKTVGFRVAELTKVFRQTDQGFINILNNIRNYTATLDDFNILNSRVCSDVYNGCYKNYIHLCSLKNEVAIINDFRLRETKNPVHEFPCTISGTFPKTSLPCEETLKLCEGARVMTIINDTFDKRSYVNGSLGTVTKISVPSSLGLSYLNTNYIEVLLDSGETVHIKPMMWENIKYTLSNDKIKEEYQGSCVQYPLRLAWASTIHKSQGLTFDYVALHLSQIFSPGQLYVALSRCRSLEGIIIDRFIAPSMINEDDLLIQFSNVYHRDNNFYIGQDITYDDDLDMDPPEDPEED